MSMVLLRLNVKKPTQTFKNNIVMGNMLNVRG